MADRVAPVSGFAERIMVRLDALAAISAVPDAITRVYLSPEQARANELVMGWMREAGMSARVDAVGNVVGRIEGPEPGCPALVVGSHLDTVRDAGRFDGPLGVVAGISCVEALVKERASLPFAIEVVGFADEEGTRFNATLTGSRAFAGRVDPGLLATVDAAGVSVAQALDAFGLDPAHLDDAGRTPDEIVAYLELHIEQGPMLERAGLPVGVVTAISGATRMAIMLKGEAGHAGTVAMPCRRDALTGAAECILAVERLCRERADLVGTVGRISASPGAVNVIPGQASFSLDLRSPDDAARLSAFSAIEAEWREIVQRRGLTLSMTRLHEASAVPCDAALTERIAAAISAEGHPVLRLPSGAGHDGMAIAAIAPIAMIFVRCRGGISHNPAEFASLPDIEAGARVMLATLRDLASRPPVRGRD